jgi:hypothetical protein
MGDLAEFQIFCGAGRYVAHEPSASGFKRAQGGERHITGSSSWPTFSTLRD